MRLNQVTLGATDFEASVRFYSAREALAASLNYEYSERRFQKS